MDTVILLQGVAAMTCAISMWLMGDKSVAGPALALFSDVCFLAVDAIAGLWVLAAFTVIMLFIHLRNLLKWRLESYVRYAATPTASALRSTNSRTR